MGGTELRSLGVEVLCDADKVSVVGITEVFSHLKDIITALSTLKKRMISDPPDLLVIIDLPDFNLRLAKKAKELGIPVADLEHHLLHEAGVAVLSGKAFGQYGDGYLRFSYANSIANIQEGLSRIKNALAKM